MESKTRPILLVEDNNDDVFLMMRSFRKYHFAHEIIVASDGVEALDHLLGRNGKAILNPMLILLDLNLPRMGGLEVLKEIKSTEQTNLIPVVILTSSSEESDIIKSYDLGVNSYIRKPVDFVKLAEVVRSISSYWLVLNESVRSSSSPGSGLF